MANSLNVNLEKGQKVELQDGRIVTCVGGFGMMSFTSGQALMIKDKCGVAFRASGYDVKRLVEKKAMKINDNDKVKCNKCGWEGFEENLIPFEDADGGGYGCPKCNTDEYLQNI